MFLDRVIGMEECSGSSPEHLSAAGARLPILSPYRAGMVERKAFASSMHSKSFLFMHGLKVSLE